MYIIPNRLLPKKQPARTPCLYGREKQDGFMLLFPLWVIHFILNIMRQFFGDASFIQLIHLQFKSLSYGNDYDMPLPAQNSTYLYALASIRE